ncbi:MAG TPA: hypothetical protein VHC49_12565 [Mycobacteriales bacterium]|nr:hypothetical protein [Mycobacteriales bacterium]
MSMLDDLAATFHTLSEAIKGVDAESVASVAEDALEQAATIGSSDLTSALESVKDAAHKLQEQLAGLADQAESMASEVSGMT